MTRIRFGRLIVLACMGLAVACTDSTDGTAGNTELNLDIVNPGGTSGELGFSIDRVDYRITCAGNPPGSYPIPDADTNGTDYNYNDSVDISGAFETVDTRVPPVWQAVMDLPPGNCTITLSVYEDDEVVCVGSQTLAILEDQTTKYDIVLVCSLSIDTPDGMADVDGTFEFITGNLCPKLYVLNAIPSTVVQDLSNPLARTEMQYRAKDPDNTCGNNCDPQTCTTANPPVCTPAPYNPNDPLCNPLAGGDPTSAACLAGGAGLVCTLAAIPTASGTPGGTFISPLDQSTPVGPVLPVNLNTASGIPGIILPGLGGPAGTNAADSPAYPGLPNVNGSLPALQYQCDTALPGPVVMNLHCSDGDADCDQVKQMFVVCPGTNFCVDQPVNCATPSVCVSDGVCDPFCDPSDLGGPGCPSGDRCPGAGAPANDGGACSEAGGQVCLGGVCVQCTSAAQCANLPAPPQDCQLANTCSAGNTCVAGGTAPAGTPCSNGVCDGSGIGAGACQFVAIDPPSTTKVLTVGCTNNVTADISILPYSLIVDPGPILSNAAVNLTYDGVAEFAETFLDAAQGAVPGGVTKANLVNILATTQVRSGGTFPNVGLVNEPIPYECLFSDTGPGVQVACNPANDLASVPGSRGNTDCVPTGSFNPCGRVVYVPISTDCTVGGVCDGLGKGSDADGPGGVDGTGQCLNGFCVTAGLPLPLAAQASSGTAGASGQILFGWSDNPSICPFPAGSLCTLPPAVFTAAIGPIGLKVNASGLSVALECNQASDQDPNAIKSADSALLPFNIQIP
jgi:hypothetical protein